MNWGWVRAPGGGRGMAVSKPITPPIGVPPTVRLAPPRLLTARKLLCLGWGRELRTAPSPVGCTVCQWLVICCCPSSEVPSPVMSPAGSHALFQAPQLLIQSCPDDSLTCILAGCVRPLITTATRPHGAGRRREPRATPHGRHLKPSDGL